MRVFITGGTGFIGTHLIERFARSGHDITCLVRESSDTGKIKGIGAEMVTGDIRNMESMLDGMKGADWVVNLANVYSFWEPRSQVYSEVNVEGTRNLMACSLAVGVSKVLHVSSMAVFGKPRDCPFTEKSPVGPVRFSEYARTKYEGERVAWTFHQEKGLPLVVLYPGGILGPGDPKASGQYIQNLIHRRMPCTVCNDSIITWVGVKDVAEAIVRALEKEDNVGEKYLVGKQRLSIKEMNEMVSEISGVDLPKAHLPDRLVTPISRFLTWWADLIGRPPGWGMAADQIRTMRMGFSGDGSKAERELGITYTPIRKAMADAIASYKKKEYGI